MYMHLFSLDHKLNDVGHLLCFCLPLYHHYLEHLFAYTPPATIYSYHSPTRLRTRQFLLITWSYPHIFLKPHFLFIIKSIVSVFKLYPEYHCFLLFPLLPPSPPAGWLQELPSWWLSWSHAPLHSVLNKVTWEIQWKPKFNHINSRFQTLPSQSNIIQAYNDLQSPTWPEPSFFSYLTS